MTHNRRSFLSRSIPAALFAATAADIARAGTGDASARATKWKNPQERIERHRQMGELWIKRYLDAPKTNVIPRVPAGYWAKPCVMGPGLYGPQAPGVKHHIWELNEIEDRVVEGVNWWTAEWRLFAGHIPGYHIASYQIFPTEDGWVLIYTYGGIAPDTVRARSLGLAGKPVYTTEIDINRTNEKMEVERYDIWMALPSFDPLLQLVADASGYTFSGYEDAIIKDIRGQGVDDNKPATKVKYGANWVIDGAPVPVPGHELAR